MSNINNMAKTIDRKIKTFATEENRAKIENG